MKLINTAKAGEILGCSYNRVAALIAQGHLKDYNERKADEKKHYHKVSEVEVRDLKKNFKLAYRGLEPRNNGSHALRVTSAPKSINAVHVSETIEEQLQKPIVSISARLKAIEDKLVILEYTVNSVEKKVDQLMKMWA